MSPYALIRPALMRLDAERAHKLVVRTLARVSKSRHLIALEILLADRVPQVPVERLGLSFKNPVGLAAGFDKDALAFPALAGIGFGFVEIGTVTPKPQRGNPGRRLFRIDRDEVIINRMGFNSCGLDNFCMNLEDLFPFPESTVLGINIGKNSDTPNNKAIDDYLRCFKRVYRYADYIAVNVSSPNTPELRELQKSSRLDELLCALSEQKDQSATEYNAKSVPIAIKISPDLDIDEVHAIVETASARKIDAIIATNTTTARPEDVTDKNYQQSGGLSGAALHAKSTQIIREVSQVADESMTIIGCGGVFCANDAWEKLLAGADLVQVYSSMIFRGTAIVKKTVSGLAEMAKPYDDTDFANAVALARKEQQSG